MDGKKYPGKFTVRFSLHDPLQRQAAELLNQQGRSKAQYIANAILSYTGGQVSVQQGVPTMDSKQLRSLVEAILTQRQDQDYEKMPVVAESPTDNNLLNDAERRVIFQTLDAFQQQ